jgi:hypothetical protein
MLLMLKRLVKWRQDIAVMTAELESVREGDVGILLIRYQRLKVSVCFFPLLNSPPSLLMKGVKVKPNLRIRFLVEVLQ